MVIFLISARVRLPEMYGCLCGFLASMHIYSNACELNSVGVGT